MAKTMTLAAWMDHANLSVPHVAERLGVSVSTVYRLRTGARPSLALALAIHSMTGGRVPSTVWQ